MSPLPFSTAAENNKEVIAEQIGLNLSAPSRLLEVASGTGQHAEFCTEKLPHIVWQPSDVEIVESRLRERVVRCGRPTLLEPIVLNIDHWPNLRPAYDGVFSANCIHIIPPHLLPKYVQGAAKSLKRGGLMMLYGPFKYGGEFTTESNRNFNQWLADRYDGAGIRDFETIDELAADNGLTFLSDQAMPANNQFIVWKKG